MAKKEKNTMTAAQDGTEQSRLAAFWHNERTQFVAGLLILLIGCFFGLAFLSFLFTGAADQALIEHVPLRELAAKPGSISNWMGIYGAYFAEVFVNRWIGVAAFLYVYFLLRAGLRLMRFEPLMSLLGLFVRCALWSLWFSLFFGFTFVRLYGDTFLYLGGRHGYALTQILLSAIGAAGVLLVLIASFVILSLFVFKSTIAKTRRIIDLWPYIKARRAAARARRKEAQRQKADMAAAAAASTESAAQNPDYAPATAGWASTAEEDVSDLPSPSDTPEMELTDSEEPQDTPSELDSPPELDSPKPEEHSTTSVASPIANETPATTSAGEVAPREASAITEADNDTKPTADDHFQVISAVDDRVSEPIEPEQDYDPTAELSHYKFPTFDLLRQDTTDPHVDMEEQNANREKIKKTLHDYGIEIQDIKATVGPTITLFEIVPIEGTRIAKIRGLQDEIAMSIAANSGIRIIAPIPGKTAIGIEVPNRRPQIVSMHSVITSRAFQESRYELPVALGKTITNEVFTFDLTKMPHLLVAGATGQGKSVGLNAILTSLLYKKHPATLKMVLVDPKQVEFSIYSRIERHYLAKLPDEEEPIITDVSKVVATLSSVVIEMEDRYALLKDAGLRNIKEYNAKFIHHELNPQRPVASPSGSRIAVHHHYLPYIVVVVDEYGDLIMTAGKEIELPIARIAQKARAVGIHMIIATQRPSARIITGIIKANFPARMAFRVGQGIDSNIILDKPGAQQLIGRGDLLFSEGSSLTRVQCAFVDTPEVERINRYIAEQQAYPTAFILPEPPEGDGAGGDGGSGDEVDLNHLDPYFNEAAELVVSSGQGSTSMIQRKFSIGYTRAGRLMDQLEAAGIVGPYEGSKARAVLVGDEVELRKILEGLKK